MRNGVALAVVSLALAAPVEAQLSARHVEVRATFAAGDRSLDEMRERADLAESLLARCDDVARRLPGEPQVVVRLSIDARGRARDPDAPTVVEDGLDRVHRCVAQVLAQLRFERGSAGTIEVVVAWVFDDPEDSPGVARELPFVPHVPSFQRHRPHRAVPPYRPDAPATLPRETIRQVVRDHAAAIARCYERARAASPDVVPRLLLRFMIMPDGSVGLPDPAPYGELETCVRDQVRSWRFPAYDGHPILVTYPFIWADP